MSDDTLNALLQYGMHDPPTILLLEDVDLLSQRSAFIDARSSRRQTLPKKQDSVETWREEHWDGEKRKRGGRLALASSAKGIASACTTSGLTWPSQKRRM